MKIGTILAPINTMLSFSVNVVGLKGSDNEKLKKFNARYLSKEDIDYITANSIEDVKVELEALTKAATFIKSTPAKLKEKIEHVTEQFMKKEEQQEKETTTSTTTETKEDEEKLIFPKFTVIDEEK